MFTGHADSFGFIACATRQKWAAEVQAFLSYLANDRKVAASTHKRALCALLFLYKRVLQMALPWMEQLH